MASSARIDELRKKFDENPRRYFAPLANEYRKAGDLEQAVFICQEYLPQQPGHMSGHIVYGQALFELGRLEEARQVFETALSLDPENLIALRHLGDIARQTGDSRTARSWYQRVLEADPRNEEIAQIMMTLLSTPVEAQVAVPATPSSTTTPAGSADGFEPTSLTFEVEKPTDGSDLAVGPELGALPGRQTPAAPPPVAPPPPPSAAQIPEEELLDIDDFTIGGVPLTQLDSTPSVDQPAAASEPFTESRDAFVSETMPLPTVLSVPAPEAGDEDASIEKSDDPFEADPLAIASAPVEELATDIVLDLPDDSAEPAVALDDAAVLGLETFEPGIVAPVNTERLEIEASTDFDALLASTSSTESEAVAPAMDALAAEPANDPFVPVSPAFDAPVFDAPVLDAAEAAASAAPEPTALPAIDAPADALEANVESRASESEPIATFEIPQEPVSAAEPSAPAASDERDTESALVAGESPATSFETPAVADIAQPAAPVTEPGPMVSAMSPTPVVNPALIEPAHSPPAPAFVTETMAELYLQQGHLEAALEIYQQLVAQRSDDAALLDRLKAIEARVSGAASPAPAAAAGPTIREFLMNLVWPGPVADDPDPSDAGYAGGPPPIDEEFGSASDVDATPVMSMPAVAVEDAPAEIAPAAETPVSSPSVRPTPSASATVSGSLDALFSGAEASPTDVSAASTLAQAFADDAPDTPLRGMPAHRAANELSLDRVFKTNPAPRPSGETEAFSFDQFFAAEMLDGGKAGDASAAPGDSDDIEQFNNWLNGLKKS